MDSCPDGWCSPPQVAAAQFRQRPAARAGHAQAGEARPPTRASLQAALHRGAAAGGKPSTACGISQPRTEGRSQAASTCKHAGPPRAAGEAPWEAIGEARETDAAPTSFVFSIRRTAIALAQPSACPKFRSVTAAEQGPSPPVPASGDGNRPSATIRLPQVQRPAAGQAAPASPTRQSP